MKTTHTQVQTAIEQLNFFGLVEALLDLDNATGIQLTDLCELGLIEPTSDERDVELTDLGWRVFELLVCPTIEHTAPLLQGARQARALRRLYDTGTDITAQLAHAAHYLTAATVAAIQHAAV